MFTNVSYRFQRLLVTSEAIERQPLVRRPRFMAAAWGGLLVCKLGAMVLISVAAGLPLLLVVLVGGALAVQFRFRHERRPGFAAPAVRATSSGTAMLSVR